MPTTTQTLPTDEFAFKTWLADHATDALRDAGIRPSQTVLDYGCNTGPFTLPAAGLVGPAGTIHALDIDANALATLRRRAADAGLTNIETTHVTEAADVLARFRGQIDTVILYDVLQVIDDKAGLLRALHATLKPGGTLTVFPMHVGVDAILKLATTTGLFTLRARQGMLLHFSPITDPGRPNP